MKPIPPLLELAAGRRVRPRKAPIVRPLEIRLHMAVAGLLREYIADGWRWGHIPSGEKRDAITAAKLKRMGAPRGWPDLVLFSPRGQLHGLELKRLGESLSDDQQAFELWSISAGAPYAVAWTIDEALQIFTHWRCLRINVAKSGGAA